MSDKITNARLEMFCDGVFAIAITLLVLEIKVPPVDEIHSMVDAWHGLIHLWPSFLAMIISFIVILVNWIGHHNFMLLVDRTSSKFQLANGFLLFATIMIPFATSYMAEYLNTPYAKAAIVTYCFNSFLTNLGWRLIIRYSHPLVSTERHLKFWQETKIGNHRGFFIYLAIFLLALWIPYVALSLSLMMWMYWLYLGVKVRD